MGATAKITELEERLREVELEHPSPSIEWANAHADLEQAVYAHLGLPWTRANHFVSKMEADAAGPLAVDR
jgi:hypothetical protein